MFPIFFLGCDPAFDPKGDFEKGLVVYSVMKVNADTQYVRVHATYDPPGFNPLEYTLEPDLSVSSVVIRSDSGVQQYSDTLIAHPDSERYGSTMRVFFAAPFSPRRGLGYTLDVQVPGYPPASATTVIPRPPSEFYVTNSAILSSPRLYSTQDINVVFKAPPEARGYVVRLYIEYEVLSTPPSIQRTEVPFTLVQTASTVTPQYPGLTQLPKTQDTPFTVPTLWSFQTEAYTYMLDDLVNIHGFANLRFRRALVYLFMLDEDVYTYYNLANGFRDEFSIRTDRPDFSNISGGAGVFGSLTVDSLSVPVNSFIQF
jgi:hypothetical protein